MFDFFFFFFVPFDPEEVEPDPPATSVGVDDWEEFAIVVVEDVVGELLLEGEGVGVADVDTTSG